MAERDATGGNDPQDPMGDLAPAEVYLKAIDRETVRVCSLMDREAFSPTFGCLDRTYWAWKFTDFPGARFQEGLCVLSFLYATAFAGNRYYQHPKLLAWIAGGFDFWSQIQRRGGDFDEAYPFERSLAATAFTVFYLAEAWHLLAGHLPNDTARRFTRSLVRAGDWLCRNDEKHGFLSNHLAAAAAALYHVYRISGEARFEQRGKYFIDTILAHQSPEGWYDEYGGADPGYQTHGSFYLARYLELSQDERVAASLEHSFAFLAHFVHPDGSLGGEYASRNTQTYYPAAFEMLSTRSGRAHWIAAAMLESVRNLSAAGLRTVDIYNFFPLLNNYVFAYLACRHSRHRAAGAEPPSAASGLLHFPQAGLLKVRTPSYDLYIGLTKGGVLKAFDRHKQQLVLNDCGYMGRMKDGRLLSSQWLDQQRSILVTPQEVIIEGRFYVIKKPMLKPVSFLGFRVFSLSLGRVRWIAYWLKTLLVKKLIYQKRPLDVRFRRHLVFQPDRFTVTDFIQSASGHRIDTLQRVDVFTTIHMGSSRYFVPNELQCNERNEADNTLDVNQIQNGLISERHIVL